MSRMGWHYTRCNGGGGGGIVVVLVLLALGSGAVSAVMSAAVTVIEVVTITIAALGTAGVIVAAVLIARRYRATPYPGLVRREPAREAVTATVPQVTAPPVPAIAPPQVVNFNFYGADERAAALIRQALPGTAGDADHQLGDSSDG